MTLSGAFVKALISGTIINPASIVNAPALIGDCKIVGKEFLKKIFNVINVVLKIKLHQIEIFVAPFQ